VGELSGGWVGSPGPCPNLPEGGFSGAARGRVLSREKAAKAKAGGYSPPRLEERAGEGRGFRQAYASLKTRKCEEVQRFSISAFHSAVFIFSQINVLFGGLHFSGLS
jgi:hypothetical protein